ncbi:MAG: sulfite exporter TauE/SafE family protein [Chromatocurvus sp.]
MDSVTQWLPVISALIAAGLLAGVLAGLLGVGGGIVIVPVLFLIFQSLGITPATAMIVATSTSLMVIVPTSIASARAHHRRGNVDLVLFRRWLWFLLAGVVLGTQVVSRVDGVLLTGVFGVVVLLIAANTLLRPHAPPLRDSLPIGPVQGAVATIIGALSVMMGIGGGALSVTVLTSWNVPAHRAVGTSALFGLVIALPGALLLLLTASTPADAPPGTVGLVNLPGFAAIAPLTYLMAPLGVRLGARLSGVALKKVFAVFLTLVGLRMLWQVLAEN